MRPPYVPRSLEVANALSWAMLIAWSAWRLLR